MLPRVRLLKGLWNRGTAVPGHEEELPCGIMFRGRVNHGTLFILPSY